MYFSVCKSFRIIFTHNYIFVYRIAGHLLLTDSIILFLIRKKARATISTVALSPVFFLISFLKLLIYLCSCRDLIIQQNEIQHLFSVIVVKAGQEHAV